MRNPFKRKIQIEGNVFANKKALAQFLGRTAGLLISGEISREDADTTSKLVLDFYKLLAFKDFSFELLDLGTPEPKEKLAYST